ncbi:MAG: monovalent cation/H(+) antiporter subunit G [bacterium]|nr:monovalent cation/H(+) antiporter subunit G [bacterium]
MPISEVVGLVFVGIGVFFSLVGVVGIIRLPDVYSRIHASGKVSTLGIIGLLVGAAFLLPDVTLKAFVLALLLVITSPVASHAIAAAAHRQGIAPVQAVRDDLSGKRTAIPPNM